MGVARASFLCTLISFFERGRSTKLAAQTCATNDANVVHVGVQNGTPSSYQPSVDRAERAKGNRQRPITRSRSPRNRPEAEQYVEEDEEDADDEDEKARVSHDPSVVNRADHATGVANGDSTEEEENYTSEDKQNGNIIVPTGLLQQPDKARAVSDISRFLSKCNAQLEYTNEPDEEGELLLPRVWQYIEGHIDEIEIEVYRREKEIEVFLGSTEERTIHRKKQVPLLEFIINWKAQQSSGREEKMTLVVTLAPHGQENYDLKVRASVVLTRDSRGGSWRWTYRIKDPNSKAELASATKAWFPHDFRSRAASGNHSIIMILIGYIILQLFIAM